MNLAVRNLGLPLLAVLLFEGAGSAKCVDHTPRFLATDLGCLYQGADCASAATSVSHNRPTDTTTTLAQVYVAGYSSAPGGVKHAFVWHQAWNPAMRDLGTLYAGKGGPEGSSFARGVNRLGDAVGYSTSADVNPAHRAFYAPVGRPMIDLQRLLPAGIQKSEATAVNDNQIAVGWFVDAQNHTRVFQYNYNPDPARAVISEKLTPVRDNIATALSSGNLVAGMDATSASGSGWYFDNQANVLGADPFGLTSTWITGIEDDENIAGWGLDQARNAIAFFYAHGQARWYTPMKPPSLTVTILGLNFADVLAGTLREQGITVAAVFWYPFAGECSWGNSILLKLVDNQAQGWSALSDAAAVNQANQFVGTAYVGFRSHAYILTRSATSPEQDFWSEYSPD